MSKAPKEIKLYSRKDMFFKVLPWAIIFTAMIAIAGLSFGWTMRSDFDATIKQEVVEQVKDFTDGLEAKQ